MVLAQNLRKRAKQEIEIDAKTGRYQILSSEEEKAFVNLCISMSKIGVVYQEDAEKPN